MFIFRNRLSIIRCYPKYPPERQCKLKGDGRGNTNDKINFNIITGFRNLLDKPYLIQKGYKST